MIYGTIGNFLGDIDLALPVPDTQREGTGDNRAVTKAQYEALVASVAKLQEEVRELRSVLQAAQRGERHVGYWQETND